MFKIDGLNVTGEILSHSKIRRFLLVLMISVIICRKWVRHLFPHLQNKMFGVVDLQHFSNLKILGFRSFCHAFYPPEEESSKIIGAHEIE